MRKHHLLRDPRNAEFLSIQAQDFIEEERIEIEQGNIPRFLSIQAQDFIEETLLRIRSLISTRFLSIQAQDFIEESCNTSRCATVTMIPEHSSSGLH